MALKSEDAGGASSRTIELATRNLPTPYSLVVVLQYVDPGSFARNLSTLLSRVDRSCAGAGSADLKDPTGDGAAAGSGAGAGVSATGLARATPLTHIAKTDRQGTPRFGTRTT